MSNPNAIDQSGESNNTSEWDSLKDVEMGSYYKWEHPDAIDDVEKARVMAEAEDKYMEEAIRARNKVKRMIAYERETGNPTREDIQGDITRETRYAADAIRSADTAAEIAGRRYDKRQATIDNLNNMINRKGDNS